MEGEVQKKKEPVQFDNHAFYKWTKPFDELTEEEKMKFWREHSWFYYFNEPRERSGTFYPDPRNEKAIIVDLTNEFSYSASPRMMYKFIPKKPFSLREGWVKMKHIYFFHITIDGKMKEKVCGSMKKFKECCVKVALHSWKNPERFGKASFYAIPILNFEGGRSVAVRDYDHLRGKISQCSIPYEIRDSKIFI